RRHTRSKRDWSSDVCSSDLKAEARITGEFYLNAIHVMEGATALGDGPPAKTLPQSGRAAPTEAFEVYGNYVALPLAEAFNIEYRSEERRVGKECRCQRGREY